jgi:ribA/ribD-fused uncharacterized protein
MRLLVCGGRDFNDINFIINELNRINELYNITVLIHGCADGADSIAGAWAEEINIDVKRFPANWKIYKKSAGFIRNQEMLDKGEPEMVLAFPGDKGTSDMISRSKKFCIPVIEIKKILFFKEDAEYGFLSNFAPGFDFKDKGYTWYTSEHYYQAMKSPLKEDWNLVLESIDPRHAKEKGNKILMYSDWTTKRNEIMKNAIRLKFSKNSEAARLLLETRPHYLIEYAPWGDTYWGVDRNYNGKNMLGKLLMERRNELL